MDSFKSLVVKVLMCFINNSLLMFKISVLRVLYHNLSVCKRGFCKKIANPLTQHSAQHSAARAEKKGGKEGMGQVSQRMIDSKGQHRQYQEISSAL